MNSKIFEFKERIKGKKIAVLGIGVSNTPLIKYLSSMGADITAFDKANKEKLKDVLEKLSQIDLKYSLGDDYLKSLHGFDMVFRTPGMRYDLPELLKAKEEGAQITSEMEVFFELCPAKIFAVTGSDGKTTTTTLIYNILVEEGYKCWLGGNIGNPLLDRVEEIDEKDMVVLELSSFQLHTMTKSPDIAVITNISPNHLDIHKSMEEYIDAKKNIMKYQSPKNKLVLNFDNELTLDISKESKCRVEFFSRVGDIKNGVIIEDGKIVYAKNGEMVDVVRCDEILIPGVHNIENYMAATAAVLDYVKPETIMKVATSFKGVEHRIELVRELNGIKFYNDSIASSPTRTIAGLNSFKQKVILITGGYDKKIPYDVMGEVILEKVKCLILIGQTAPKIEKALMDEVSKKGISIDIPLIRCDSIESAVLEAYKNASEGDIVTLSPASASFDMFKNFEERGNKFKVLVRELG